MAAGLASWWITAWWENVDRDARQWTAFGLALRTVVLAFLLFAPLAAAWMLLADSTAYLFAGKLGRAPCRESVGQYVLFSVVAGSVTKKHNKNMTIVLANLIVVTDH